MEIAAKTKEREQSIYIIKPEGWMNHRITIRSKIRRCGLTIVDSAQVPIPKWAVEKLSLGLPEDLRQFIRNHLFGRMCEVGIVEGDGAIKKLLEICGESYNPNECAPGTIRREFAPRMPHWTGKRTYWLNVIHQPKDEEEAARDLELILKLLPKK